VIAAPEVLPYPSAAEHTRDELALVGLFVARAIARGRAQGWLRESVQPIDVPDEAVFERFRAIEQRLAATRDPLAMDLVRRRLGLTLTEQRVLWTLVGYELDPRLRRLLQHVATEDTTVVTIGTLLSVVYDDTPGSGYVELSPAGRLMELRLIAIDDSDSAAPISQRRIRVVDRVLELAAGIVRLDRDLERFARIEPPTERADLVMDPAVQESVDSQLYTALVQPSSPVVVVVGPEGSGRRSLLRAAAARAGLTLVAIDSAQLPATALALELSLRAAFREALLFDGGVIFDNLDLLERDEATGERFRHFDVAGLTAFQRPVLATTAGERPLRTARGVSWITVPPLREIDRAALWSGALPPTTRDDLIAQIAARYQVTGGVIVAAAARARQRAEASGIPLDADEIHDALRSQIDTRLGGLGTRVTTTQRWDDVVLPDETFDEVKEMVARVKHRRLVYEDWGFASKLGRGLGISALFFGAPGTGKTMVAGLIARELGLDLYQIDLSRIVSKWVGETEKHLSALFAAAEAGHAVILFDEADSLFSKRTDVKSSNDRYANLEVNYLLQRMESFAGITILTTNHDTAIDEAFRRRLSFRIEFPVPEADERARIWRATLPAKARVASNVNFAELAEAYEMTGGYIRNAALRAAFFAASAGSDIKTSHLRRAANLEMASMGKVVGRAHS